MATPAPDDKSAQPEGPRAAERKASPFAEAVDASRRTHLAGERTELAWWRTGLAALAVAIAVGRIVPELATRSTSWAYVAVGIGFAVWGMAAIGYGSIRGAAVGSALHEGHFLPSMHVWHSVLMVGGLLLGLASALLVAFG